MAGRYSRTYSRKKSAAPPISQFDRLVTEHGKSAHPVASKTAGHVGKWGMTSFTSLRNISETLGREEGGKRNWIDSPPGSGNIDTISSDSSTTDLANPAAVPSKRRKFFKSRDCNSVSSSTVPPTSSSSSYDNASIDAPTLSHNQSSEEVHNQKRAQNVNSFTHKNLGNSQLKSQKSISGLSHLKPGGGGIKLKIFKSRNNDQNSCETYSSTVQLPSDDSGSASSSSSVANSPMPDSAAQPEVERVQSPNGLVIKDSCSTSADVVSAVDKNCSLKENLIEVSCNLGNVKSNSSVLRETRKISPSSICNLQLSSDNIEDDKKYEMASISTDSVVDKHGVNTKRNIDLDCEQNGSLGINVNCELNTVEDSECYRTISNEKESLKCCYKDIVDNKIESPPHLKESQELNLFGSDFEENEIVDRTSIEYPNSSTFKLSGPQVLSRANTIDLDETELSLSSSLTSLSSASFKSRLQPEKETSKLSGNKKKSIFKSRQKEGEPKKRATYKHKWHGNEDKDDSFKKQDLPKSASVSATNEDPFDFDSTPVLKRVQTWPSTAQAISDSFEEEPVTTVKCPKQAKKYYTVIKNVKKTHQLQESGEFQEFNDDVEYFLDALRNSNSVSTRCLASLNLAQKCMTPAFRMHLRAHATVIKFFRALSDAPSFPQLAECAAMVMFALSQDRLNMDLDRGSLELMLNLLDADTNGTEAADQLSEAAAIDQKSKIRSLCKELQQRGHAKHLKLDNIKAATLAMETLLSLTSKRAGEWFKEELRELGGVDHLIRTVTSYSGHFHSDIQSWSPFVLDKLSKIDRCLKVLENVTHQNESNQEYLLSVNKGEFSNTLMRLFKMCHKEVPLNPLKPQGYLALSNHNPLAAKGIVTTLITTVKVLINLTHGSRKEALGSKILGKDEDIYNISIYCLLIMPMYLDHDTKFEIQVLACCLLLNLVENSPDNRQRLMSLKSPMESDDDIFSNRERETAMSSLITLFYTSEESARVQEAHTDQIIDKDLVQETNKEEEKKDEDIEETVARLLQKAGRHMEDTLIAAYTALLAGYCLMDNKEFEESIRLLQPEGHFKTMVAVLRKFLHFMNLTATTSLLRSLKPTERVVKYMESLDRSPEEEAEEKQKKEEAAQAMAFEAFGF